MKRIRLFAALLIIGAVSASSVLAQTADELLAQIQTLRNQVTVLQSQLNTKQNTGQTMATGTISWLQVTKTGNGSGLVYSNDGGINCGNDCSEGYASGTWVYLHATANVGSVFTSWGGDCSYSTTSDCTVVMNRDRNVSARFDLVNSPPEITYVSGPTRLAVNATGTWTFGANDPDGNLSVWNIAWGDNSSTTRPAYGSSSIEVFEHRYATTGLKTIWIEIRDTALAHDIATTTVKVIGPTKSNLGYQQGSLIESAKTQLAAMVAQLQAMLKSLR